MRIYKTAPKEDELIEKPDKVYDEEITNAVAEDMRDALKETKKSYEPEKVEEKGGLDTFY